MLLKVFNVSFHLFFFSFFLPHLLSVFVPIISTAPPAVFSLVKPREVLMCFTAMIWSTSCSITMLWWLWWLRTSQPTWRPWGSSPKVLCHGQKWHLVLVGHVIFIDTAVGWALSAVWLFLCVFTEEQAEFDPQTVRPGSRYSHVQEVQERLNFLRYDSSVSHTNLI